jgi:hypothetical protein
MSINVIDTIKPKSSGFPVAEAIDIAVEGYPSLAEAVTHFATDEIIAVINAVLSGKANNADVATSLQNLQGQIDQIVISSGAEAVVAPEVAAARVDQNGIEYTTLKERIDNNQENLQSQISAISSELFPVSCGAWELGTLNDSGSPGESTRYARTSDFIKLASGKIYTVEGYAEVNVGKTPKITAYFYDETYIYISSSDVTGLRFKADGKFMKLVYFYQGTDTDVSLSDARLTELSYISNIRNIDREVENISNSLAIGVAKDGFIWEHGLIDLSSGIDKTSHSMHFMRSVGYTKKPTDDYFLFDFPTIATTALLAAKLTIYFYDDSFAFISQKSVTNGERMKVDYPYFRLVYFYQDTPSTITVNPSDAEEVKCVYQSIIKDNQRDDFEKMLMVDGKYIYGNLKWEHGIINMTTGQDSSPANTKYMRTVGYFKTPTSLPITFSAGIVSQEGQSPLLTAYFYDENKVLKETPNVTDRTMVVNYPYFRLVYFYQGTTVDVDIEDAETTTFSYVPEFKLPLAEVESNSSNIIRLDECLFNTGKLTYGADYLKWEHGIINMTTGQDNPAYNKKFARNIGYIETPTDRPITFTADAPINSEQTPKITIYYYDSEKELVSTTDITGKTVTIDYPYFRLVYFYQNTPVDVDLRDAQTTQYGYVPKLQLSIPIIGTFTRNKYVAFGDSITWGHLRGSGTGTGRASDPYPSVVARSLGLDVTYGAQTGSGWVHPSGNKTAVTIVDSFDCSNYNLATLAFGTNDWYGNIPMGTLSDTGTTTIIGAMKHCVEKILSDNPSICLIIITPINAKNLTAIDGAKTNQGNYRYNTPNTQGITLEDICAAEVQVAEYYGVPCIDNSKGSIVNRQNTANGSIFIDNLHPTDDFYKTLGQYYSGRIGEYFRGYVSE